MCVTSETACCVDRRRCYTTPLKTRIQVWKRSRNTLAIKWQVHDIIVLAFDMRLGWMDIDTCLDGLCID